MSNLPGVAAGPDGMQRALAEAVAEHRMLPKLQPSLFAPDDVPATENLPAERKAGRPPGTGNRCTEDAQFLLAKHGNPLDVATAVAARNIAAPGELQRLAQELDMDRKHAAEFWLRPSTQGCPSCTRRCRKPCGSTPARPAASVPR